MNTLHNLPTLGHAVAIEGSNSVTMYGDHGQNCLTGDVKVMGLLFTLTLYR